MDRVRLHPGAERRLAGGHLWVFSNEIDQVDGVPAAGDMVTVESAAGVLLGCGLYHPRSLIAVRLLASQAVIDFDADLVGTRLEAALAARRRYFPGETCYRLCYGESDGLPGLVIDRYGEHLVLQTTSAGMDMRLPLIVGGLRDLLSPRSIYERNEAPLRALEGLPPRAGALQGEEPGTQEVQHDGLWERADLVGGQKTGLYLDQRLNRRLLAGFAAGRRVVDCFCYQGGFALRAALAGATSVLGLDSSRPALELAGENARRNGVADRCEFHCESVFNAIPRLRRHAAEPVDLVVLDPPSFTRSRRHVPQAKRAYRELNTGALRLLAPGGILASSSCSHHIRPDTFLEILAESARGAGRNVRLLAVGTQAPDHPVLLAMPETHYLKFAILEVAA